MANHPSRKRGPYTAVISGKETQSHKAVFPTIRECRAYAESYGRVHADRCDIFAASGVQIGAHVRDRSGDGMTWFRASF